MSGDVNFRIYLHVKKKNEFPLFENKKAFFMHGT